MSGLLTFIHVVICLVLIMAVLLQSGKSADLAGAFGGVGSQTAFGPRGVATLLSKATTICAILFMFTSLGMWILSGKGARSALRGGETPARQTPAAATTTQKEQPNPQTEGKKARQQETGQQKDTIPDTKK
ncbi:MAG: preprotein translocase subunit SecG [Candidatus Aminicenantales bacterium]